MRFRAMFYGYLLSWLHFIIRQMSVWTLSAGRCALINPN